MPKKKGKTISFDAMVKFFMRNYDIPTKKDVEKLMEKLDRIEHLLRTTSGRQTRASNRRALGPGGKTAGAKTALTASTQVLEIIKRYPGGVGFADIRAQSGFEDKKLRNIIFRLNKLNQIRSKSRGIYIAV